MDKPVIRLEGVSKSYDGTRAVDGVSFRVERGRIFGLLGPNGAGKTTTIRMIMGIIYPDSGIIEIFDGPLTKHTKERIGYLPEERGLYRKMRVLELLVFFAELKGMSKKDARREAQRWLQRMGLWEQRAKKTEELSKGMQQKIQFIITVLHRPELIILDEPFAGLDPVNTNLLKDIILEFSRSGHTIVFSTHMMDQVEKMCDEICLIDKGRVVLAGELSEVKKRYGRNGVSIRFAGDGSFLKDLPGVARCNDYGNEVFLRLEDGTDPTDILKAAAERLEVLRFEVAEPSVHDIFLEQVGAVATPGGSEARAAGDGSGQR